MTNAELNKLIQDNLETKAKLKAELAALPKDKDPRPLKRKIAKCNRTHKEFLVGKLILSFQQYDIPRL